MERPNPSWSPGCKETDPLALTGTHPRSIATSTMLVKRRPWLEAHHPSGRQMIRSTVEIPGNEHRVLSELQNATWPRETLRNPDGSPLLRAAAAIRGWLDLLWVVMHRTVGWVPASLEVLDAWLRERVGARLVGGVLGWRDA